MARNYSNTAVSTTLSTGINNSAMSITVASVTGYPAAPFTIIIDPGTASEELCEVTHVSGNTFTVTRGVDGTPATAHGTGAVVVHGASARDFSEPQAHIDASTNVHGVGSGAAVVGTTSTQTLTNKTLTSPTINNPTISGGTWTSPSISGLSLTSPTISSPTVTGGTLTSSTLVTPTIASFVNAQHDHSDAAGGGTLSGGGGGSGGWYAGGVASSTTNQNTSSSSFTDINSMSLTFTAPSTWPTDASRIAIHLSMDYSLNGGDGIETFQLRTQLDGSTLSPGTTTINPSFVGSGYVHMTWLATLPAAGSHTAKCQINPGGSSMSLGHRQLWVTLV